MKQYETVIGLEVHVELSTKSKMFCSCSADYFGKEPNTHTCPVCLGLPGALPYINKEAIESCIKIGHALNCNIKTQSVFERKNYFYPDLAKGYQISQYRWPLCVSGKIEVVSADGTKKDIRINRAHQEEDTGKLSHRGRETLIDFNRSGVPLVEIVTEPDFTDTVQIRDYAKKLQAIMRSIGVSNADMERGDMRLEANVSIRGIGQKELPNYRVELKNINSFRFMVAAVEYEIQRQSKLLSKGERLHQETRGWNEDKKITYLQRSKEEAHDYRYFPEPDLPPIFISPEEIEKLKGGITELPAATLERFKKDYQLGEYEAEILTRDKKLADYFEQVILASENTGIGAKKVANEIINKKPDIEKVLPADFVNQIHSSQQVFAIGKAELETIVKQVLEENSKAVEDYKKGKESVKMFLVGQVIRMVGKKIDTNKVKEAIKKSIK